MYSRQATSGGLPDCLNHERLGQQRFALAPVSTEKLEWA
jgi:hypothetical protein